MKKSCESLYNLFWIFIVGCVVGWFVEGVFSLIKWKEFINHSAVVIGPFNMAYGLGALMLTALLYKFRNEKNIKIFFAGGDELPRKPEEITIFRQSVVYGGNTRNPVKSSQRGFYRGRLG